MTYLIPRKGQISLAGDYTFISFLKVAYAITMLLCCVRLVVSSQFIILIYDGLSAHLERKLSHWR
jgi:hypothetical protein